MSQKNKEVEKLPPQWSSSPNLRNPRIVRAPRDSGGKDRHSKVCTLRGLRDRRIRLSVPTAIQLYDLQDRLGLPQPSKVVDWLLDAAKDDVDLLPPLPSIPGLLPHHDQPPNGAFGGFQNFFPTGNGQGFSLPYEGPSGSNGNSSSNYYMSNWDPAALSLAGFGGGFGFGAQVAEEEKLQAFATGSGSGSGSHHHHHHLY